MLLWLLAFAFGEPVPASAEVVHVNSGTGFFISRQGDILTSAHVLKGCAGITVQGAVTPRDATLVARDEAHDLALLKVDAVTNEAAALRDPDWPVAIGEGVAIIGYPGESFKTLTTVTREAEITSDKGPRGEEAWVQISDRIEQGNSGGPLLDMAGNVIGVIMAKAIVYTYHKNAPDDGEYSHSGVAIAVPVVRAFLDAHGVTYAITDVGGVLGGDRITDYAHRFIVNVRCEMPEERP